MKWERLNEMFHLIDTVWLNLLKMKCTMIQNKSSCNFVSQKILKFQLVILSQNQGRYKCQIKNANFLLIVELVLYTGLAQSSGSK